MIKVLAIYPAFDWRLNEMAMVWQLLCQSGQVKCSVFASRKDRLKGHVAALDHESSENLEVFRLDASLVSQESIDKMIAVAEQERPDLIFCATSPILDAAQQIRQRLSVPVLVHDEFLSDRHLALPRRQYLGIEALRPFAVQRRARRLLMEIDAMVCSNPKEFDCNSRHPLGEKVFYLPWPHPAVTSGMPVAERDPELGIYIGSISKPKGAANLKRHVSALLAGDPHIRVRIIGPATDRQGEDALRALREGWPDRVSYLKSCSRSEAMQQLASASFVFSAGVSSNWGLIGDAWNAGTPVLSPNAHYDLDDGENCLVCREAQDFVAAVRRLRDDGSLWRKLSQGGSRTVRELHSVQGVAECLLAGLYATLGKGARAQ
ncbi:glycosyltransferase family protein [Crenobacter intestini]|uniref:Glycosyltransferase n=1 Tax=Crenobacter intestini TaxID=2563443 RepID=A0A4T0V249_9NEIS|nr:glycosyltransferase [Crenobacter intestini]TIC85331.1 glycosyltransferase [Crenobacter intestini]